MYAIGIALYHDKLGKNPGRISKKLDIYSSFNRQSIDFPASFEDYETFERLNSDIALNILYVLFEQQNVPLEYISNHNFDKINQVILLKITDGKDKWHFVTLPSVLDENDCVKTPYKSLSRVMEGISSNSHEDYYCLGCFHSFRTETTLKDHVNLCKNNKFDKIKVPEEASNL